MKIWLLKFKKEPVLSIAMFAAIASFAITPPSLATLNCINGPVLMLLFSLMAVVEGFQQTGFFWFLSRFLLKRVKGLRSIVLVIVLLTFCSSMFITNDVALITFVPLTLLILKNEQEIIRIRMITFETIAANLGSMATPVGNPQNIYLYTHFGFSVVDFMKLMMPVTLISLMLIIVGIFILFSNNSVKLQHESIGTLGRMSWRAVVFYGILFFICLLAVIGVISHLTSFLIVLITLSFLKRNILRKIDYMLLMTFVCFFILSANLSEFPALHSFLSMAMERSAFFVSLGVSQFLSNVPAAVLLSRFTENATALMLGTDIGGLGTLVASLASLISYRFVSRDSKINIGRYLLVFTVYNLLFLVCLIPFGLSL